MSKKSNPQKPGDLPIPGRQPEVNPVVPSEEPTIPGEDPEEIPAEEPGGPEPGEIPTPSKEQE